MIRPATQADVPILVAIGEVMHRESRYATMPYCGDRIAAMTAHLIDDQDGFVYIAERDGNVIGGYVAFIQELWFGPGLIAHNLALYMLPWDRGGMEAVRLVREFIAWAHAEGVRRGDVPVTVQLGASSGITEGRTTAFFERLGFERIGTVCEMRA